MDLDQEPLEEACRRVADLVVGLLRGLESRRVDPGVTRDEVRLLLSGRLGEQGVGLLAAIREVEDLVLPRSMTIPHPLYLGLVNCSPLPAAVLGDFVVSALNNNAGAFHQSQAMTVLEEDVVRGFAALLGLEGDVTGMIVPGGTFATLQALTLARARHFPEWQARGPGALPGRPTLYTSDSSHFSVLRSGLVLGLGLEGVVTLPSTGRGTLDCAVLEERVERDRRSGAVPFAVVASLGTTGTGAVDPLAELAELCRRRHLWLHVDACYGGAAALLDELRSLFRGLEAADSVAVDPHKWFFSPIAAGLLLHRDPELARRTFAASHTSYFPAGSDVEAIFRGIPTSRRASALTVWLGLRAHGWDTVREAVRRNCRLTRLLEALLADHDFTVLPGGRLSVACARWEPADLGADDADRLQERIAAEVVASGRAWFSTVRHAGRTWLRFNMVNLYTREAHVRELVGIVVATARRCSEVSG